MNSTYSVFSPAFRRCIHPMAKLETIVQGMRWAEGPVWFGDLQMLVWSDIPTSRLLRWSWDDVGPGQVSVLRTAAGHPNGNTRDRDGRLVTCEHGNRRVTRTETDGTVTVLCDEFAGKRLNSPNDVVVAPDGSVWFTDPTYGILSPYQGERAEQEQDGCFVFRVAPNGETRIMADDFAMPNGLAFSPNGNRIYIADSGLSHDPQGPHHIRAFDVIDNGTRLANGRVFAPIDPGMPDGIKVDELGNLWSIAGDGIQCFDPAGECIGKLLLPEPASNLCFGGPKRNRLFITGATSVYAIFLAVRGASFC